MEPLAVYFVSGTMPDVYTHAGAYFEAELSIPYVYATDPVWYGCGPNNAEFTLIYNIFPENKS